MAIQTDNNKENNNTLAGATATIKTFSVQLASLYDYEDKYFPKNVTLEDNLVMELTNGKRGGANRLRVYLNKRNGLYAVSIRYGNNIVGHDAVIDACKGYTLNNGEKDYTVDFSAHMEVVARDGKTESRIQFMTSRCNDFLKVVSAVLDDTAEVINTAEEVTA